jgi:hypothetical protein
LVGEVIAVPDDACSCVAAIFTGNYHDDWFLVVVVLKVAEAEPKACRLIEKQK